MPHHYCTQCGHHHGQGNDWPSCGAYHNTDDGFRRCGCTHNNREKDHDH